MKPPIQTIYETYDPRARNPFQHFSAGVRFFFSGLRMLLRHPSLLAFSFIPIILTIVVLTALALSGVWLVGQFMGRGLFPFGDRLLIFVQALTLLLAFFIGFLIYLPLARVLLAPFSEAISRRAYHLVAGDHKMPEASGWSRAIAEGAKMVAFQAIIALFAFALGFFLPPLAGPLGVGVTILFVCLDFLDVPLSVRGLRLREKLRTLWRHKALALGFGAAGYLLLIIPLVNLLALPVGVIGATLLVASLERTR